MDTSSYDAMTAALDDHENIEIRLFNPFWWEQSLLVAGLTDFKRINRRMHNKSMTADNVFTIVGGRNIGAEYFLAREEMNYADLDVLAAGPVVREVSQSFDSYWNREFAVPARVVVGEPQEFGIGILSRNAQRRITLKNPMSITPYLPDQIRQGNVFTWVNSQWKLRGLPGHF